MVLPCLADGFVGCEAFEGLEPAAEVAEVLPKLTACEMTKWFDTNYHYMVPELVAGQRLALNGAKIVDDYREAKAQGYETRPVLLGPVTWLSLAKGRDVDPFDYLDEVLGLYAVILGHLAQAGAAWVQIDEPVLVLDLDDRQRRALTRAYAKLSRCGVRLMLATYFGGLGDNLGFAAALPVQGLHVDLVRAPGQVDAVLKAAPTSLLLSPGVYDIHAPRVPSPDEMKPAIAAMVAAARTLRADVTVEA